MKTIKDKEYSFNHTKKRLKERFDLLLTWNDYEILCGICTCNCPYINTLVVKENEEQEIHKIFFKGKYIKFIFNTRKEWITTALPDRKE